MKNIDIVVKIEIEGNIKEIFRFILPIDISLIFKKKGVIPGVKSTSNTENWNKAGMTRTVFFEDNSTVTEKLTNVSEFSSFSYEIFNFTSLLKYFLTQINGKFEFTQKTMNITTIVWKYTLTPRNIIGVFMIHIFIKSNIKSVLNNALHAIYLNFIKHERNK